MELLEGEGDFVDGMGVEMVWFGFRRSDRGDGAGWRCCPTERGADPGPGVGGTAAGLDEVRRVDFRSPERTTQSALLMAAVRP